MNPEKPSQTTSSLAKIHICGPSIHIGVVPSNGVVPVTSNVVTRHNHRRLRPVSLKIHTCGPNILIEVGIFGTKTPWAQYIYRGWHFGGHGTNILIEVGKFQWTRRGPKWAGPQVAGFFHGGPKSGPNILIAIE